ncbi:MAG: SRPBCC family protein [Acaryochloridaceae cyanobacterium SU_2_1]|nr:SRPBCC family protein [Acaryochloridaceae cyanobacterium SU_2_1]NJM95022.1 SRPBCC family protein [Acaryochloridaceae cyanobacterium CSU_5_19]
MIPQWLFQSRLWQDRQPLGWSLVKHYETVSSASVDSLWRKVVNLADVSWHPLITSTNVPYGLVPKPGLIYQAVSRMVPLPFRVFVEHVKPGELVSFRICALPGVEERVTYRLESRICGTSVSYSVMMRGWLSPLVWSMIKGHAAKVAQRLAEAAEQEGLQGVPGCLPPRKKTCLDF